MKNILLISGSLREESVNTKLLKAFELALPEGSASTWGNINLPLFNEDLEVDFPAIVNVLRNQILAADLVIISTPEYNRGMSGALKNALDWSSRPSGENAWVGKKVLVASASPGGIAGALALYQVKQTLLHLDAQVPGKPEFMLGGALKKFDAAGNLIDEKTKEYINSAIKAVLK